MNQELLVEARHEIRHRFGEAFALKVSDAYCAKLLKLISSRSYSFKSLRLRLETNPISTVVISFAMPEWYLKSDYLTRQLEFDRYIQKISQFSGHKAVIDIPTFRSEFRRQRIKALREEVLRMIHPFNERLDRRRLGFIFKKRIESIHGDPRPQICWLNATLRITASASALAEIANAPEVEMIDNAHQVMLDAGEAVDCVSAAERHVLKESSGKGVIVGVIDNEVDTKHPGLSGRVVHIENYTDESWGIAGKHGTAVAGVIASDNLNCPGIANEATIYNYKVCKQDIRKPFDEYNIFMALQKAVEDDVHIVNLSIGNKRVMHSKGLLAKACETAWNEGTTVVKSAGNNGPGKGSITMPGEADGVIVVGGANKTGTKVEEYSARGPLPNECQRPHLIAPGGNEADGINGWLSPNNYGPVGYGTSYAAAYVSGLSALAKEQFPSYWPEQIRSYLVNQCRFVDGYLANEQGAGFIS